MQIFSSAPSSAGCLGLLVTAASIAKVLSGVHIQQAKAERDFVCVPLNSVISGEVGDPLKVFA